MATDKYKTVEIGDGSNKFDIKVPSKTQQFFNVEHFLPKEFNGDGKKSYWKFILFILRRNVGKNYSVLKWLKKTGKSFVIIRRKKAEIDELKDDIDKNWFEYYQMVRIQNTIYNAVLSKEGFIIPQGEPVGELVYLSGVGSKAGGTSKGYDIIWFDEFISHSNYLSNETRKLISLIISMTRINENALFIGTSNPLAKSAPLFMAFDFWDDKNIEWNHSQRAIKIMLPKGSYKPMANEKESLGYLLAKSNPDELAVNFYGSFGRENIRDKQMLPRKYFENKDDLKLHWHITVDSQIKNEDPYQTTIFWSNERNIFVVMDYNPDFNGTHFALSMSESAKTGNPRIGGSSVADWIKSQLYNGNLYFTNYDYRQAYMDFVRQYAT